MRVSSLPLSLMCFLCKWEKRRLTSGSAIKHLDHAPRTGSFTKGRVDLAEDGQGHRQGKSAGPGRQKEHCVGASLGQEFSCQKNTATRKDAEKSLQKKKQALKERRVKEDE